MQSRAARVIQVLRRVLVAFVRLTLWLLVMGILAAGVGWIWLDRVILSTLPADLSEYRDFRPLTNCEVYDAEGQAIDRFWVERRVWVPLDELPDHVWQAFVAAEDRRFFQHKGVDLRGIARAVVVNLQSGGTSQGASTLTQQLVKNLIVGKERSYTRKLREAVLAIRLEREQSKEALLELYLNYVALGAGNYGVEAAAQDYFGVSARDIDVGQAALLAGLVPAPSRYSPRRSPETAAERRGIVLRSMVTLGMVSAELAAQHQDDPVLVPREGDSQRREALAYITQVRRELRALYGDELLFELGLQVHTPLNLTVQAEAEAAVREIVDAHQARQGRAPIVKRLSRDAWDSFLSEGPGLRKGGGGGQVREPAADQCFQALVGPKRDLNKLSAGPFTFKLVAEEHDALARPKNTGGDLPPTPLSRLVGVGDVLEVCRTEEPDLVRLGDAPWAQASAVVIENKTGAVVAMVGGYRDTLEGFVRASQGLRQPGSSFKPYVYAAALAKGHSQIDTVVDGPLALPAGNGQTWSPKNYAGGYAGSLPMRDAMARSLNTVAVRLALEVGVDRIAALARDMGVQTPLRADLTMALGSSEVTVLDQARGYATVARLGRSADAVFINRLLSVNQELLARAGQPLRVEGRSLAPLPGGPGRQVLPRGVAYELVDMLRGVVTAGTARRASVEGLDRAGKTGTTNGYMDAWFVGFTPRYTVAIWLGTDRTISLGEGETGGRSALPAWVRIVEALGERPGERLRPPDEAMLLPWRGGWVAVSRGRAPANALPVERVGEGPLPLFGLPRR